DRCTLGAEKTKPLYLSFSEANEVRQTAQNRTSSLAIAGLVLSMETTALFQRDRLAYSQLAAEARQTWIRGPLSPLICPNEVQIWRARLDVDWSWTFDEALCLED